MVDEQFERRLIGNLLSYGAENIRVTSKQQKKLREYIVAELNDKYGFNGGPLKLEDIKRYIDNWEGQPFLGVEMTSENFKHYYVKK